jgi:glyoxylase-like metal-dependent hydrolase (beta-lactamase superfamily II)
VAAANAQGGAAGVAITHDHEDHVEGLDALLDRIGDVPVVSGRTGEDEAGPLRVLPLPGHSDDHVAFVTGRAAFCGDAVLGEGSVFVSGDLTGYLDGLRRLQALDLAVLCPGHGDPIWDADGKLREYIAHRLDREQRLLAALERGLTSEDDLLDAVWDDAPPHLRPFAAVSLRAHLEKLRAERRA